MAMKYKSFKKVPNTSVECYTDMESDDPVLKRIATASPGFMSCAPGFIAGFTNSRNHFVFSGSREGVDKGCSRVGNLREPRKNLVSDENLKSNIEGRSVSENEGSKGDTTAACENKGQVVKSLGCDGDVAKYTNTKGYFLSSSGAKGDVLKPLDEDTIRTLGNKKDLLFRTRNKDDIIFSNIPKPLSPFKCKEGFYSSANRSQNIFCPENKETEFRGFLSNCVNLCQGNDFEFKQEGKYTTVHENYNAVDVPVINKIVDNKGFEVNSYIRKDSDVESKLSTQEVDVTKEEVPVNHLMADENEDLNEGNKHSISKCNENNCADTKPQEKPKSSSDTSNVQDKERDFVSEERELLDLYIFEMERRLAWKRSLCESNKNVGNLRPEYSYLTKLDSSVKKNTSFIRKLKIFTSNQLESLLKDISQLNLTKYLSEAASAIVQAKLKISDVTSAVELCNAIHHIYAEFSRYLLESFHRHLSFRDEDGMINCRKLNVDLKFYTELMNVGILDHEEAFPLITNVLTVAINMDKEEHNNVNVILSFYRHCKEGYAVPRRMRNLAEKYEVKLPKSNLLLENEVLHINFVLKDYYASLLDHTLKIHREVKVFERQNKKILHSRGEISADRKEKWEMMKLLYERLQYGMRNFAEELGEEVPSICNNNDERNDIDMIDDTTEEKIPKIFVWENEEEQHFYENLTDMKDFVSLSTCKAPSTPPPVTAVNEEDLDTDTEDFEEDSTTELKINEIDDVDDDVGSNMCNNKYAMDTFLSLLPNCINCDSVDQLAVEFLISLNSKCNRKKLTEALVGVPRTRLDLLPFYSRLIATLHPFVPIISSCVVQHLRQEFKYHFRKKNQINIESKIKVVRFIGELVKFRIYPTADALYCMKLLLRDFTHHNIEMCCTLLESCGRFLFRCSNTHQRIKIYLEQMMRKKSVTALESRYVTMIENAFYYVNPPDIVSVEKIEQPPMHQFIQKLLYQKLSKFNIEYVLQLITKLDWENPELAEFCIQSLIMAHNVKYNNISCLASIVSGLTCEEKEDSVGVMVVDGVMEDIRLGMEINLPKYNQRRLAMVKYMGELYKYRVAESNDVFQILYSLISFGVTLSYTNQSCLDPPDNLFRIRLVCVLLETCGQYFSSGNTIKKLDYYLVYFQRYFWFKFEDKYWNFNENPFPVGTQYMFQDTILKLRPKITLYKNFQEANQAVYQMQMAVASKFVDITFSDAYSTSQLGAIVEEDEEISTAFVDLEMENVSFEEECRENGRSSCDYEDTAKIKDVEKVDFSISHHVLAKTENIEDESFVSAFDQMITENIHNRMSEMVKPQCVDIAVPMHLRSNDKKSNEPVLQRNTEEQSMNFMLLIRKGHKQNYKCLNVPVDSELAVKLRTGREAEQAEKEYLKQLTLDMSQRLEEESYQEMLAEALNINRERKFKYHHPRGAPNVGFIFGPKKVK
ncbi:hypothetical protein ANN_21123 [Periplaneta americana]|uniref:MIF4G domain-containing protein n=1 Tax=Periplaneta americana TaxID=6978 RepID=A0ABQ8SEW9_PERAM|nr:hypothetical protein ANN_21123 [Periplaneta americana]